MTARQGAVPRRSGADALPPIEGIPDPIRILSTGDDMKGDEAAFKARLKALLVWTGIEADESSIAELLGSGLELDGFHPDDGDLIQAATEIRAEIHRRRRVAEIEVEDSVSKRALLADHKESAIGEFDEEEVLAARGCDVAEARQLADAMNQELTLLQAKRAMGLSEQARREEARWTLGPRPKVADHRARVESDLAYKRAELTTGQNIVAEQRAAVVKVAAEVETLEIWYADAVSLFHSTEKALGRWDSTAAALEAPLDIPTERDIHAAQEQNDVASHALLVAAAAASYVDVSGRLDANETAVEGHGEAVEYWESESVNVWQRLAGIVNGKLKSDVIRVEDEEIQIRVDGQWRNIADDAAVSEGLRHAACYDLLLAHRSGQQVILVEDSTPVGPRRMKEIGAAARDAGVILVFETPVNAAEGVYAVDYYPEVP